MSRTVVVTEARALDAVYGELFVVRSPAARDGHGAPDAAPPSSLPDPSFAGGARELYRANGVAAKPRAADPFSSAPAQAKTRARAGVTAVPNDAAVSTRKPAPAQVENMDALVSGPNLFKYYQRSGATDQASYERTL